MISHKVWVLSQVDGLERKPTQPLSTIDGFILSGGSSSTAGLTTPIPIHPSTQFQTHLPRDVIAHHSTHRDQLRREIQTKIPDTSLSCRREP